MFVFDTSSWHYNLVLYVFGKTFFYDKIVDGEKIRNKMKALEDKTRKEHPNDDKALDEAFKKNIRLWYDEDDTYSFTPKTVNFCPYCRAVLWSVLLLPFAAISKLIPKRKKKPFDIKKSRRNTKILKIVVMIVISIFGIKAVIDGNYGLAVFHFTVASFQIWGKHVFDWYAKWYAKRESKKIIKQKPKITKSKNPSLFSAYLKTHHRKICPPVTFVDKNDTELRR